jgi:hypothetical protein
MLPQDIHSQITSYLNFSESLDYCSIFKIKFNFNTSIDLLNNKDLNLLIRLSPPKNTKLNTLKIHFYTTEEENDLLKKWMSKYKISGEHLEMSFVWKGLHLIQISCISSRFNNSFIKVFPSRKYFLWHFNVLSNIFRNLNNNHLTFKIHHGTLFNDHFGFDCISNVNKIILYNVEINHNYCLKSLESKVDVLEIINS